MTDEYRRPGVYIEETLLTGSNDLGNAATTFLLVGAASQGRSTDPVLVESWQDFVAEFGTLGSKVALQTGTAEGLVNVRFFPPIPKAQIPTLLGLFDIAYIGWQRTPIYRFGIAPNKLIDYLMAGRAVLHSVEAGNDPVAEAGAGLTVAPEDPQAVADGLLRVTDHRLVLTDAGRLLADAVVRDLLDD